MRLTKSKRENKKDKAEQSLLIVRKPMSQPSNHAPIGIFDSGVGGLSVLRAIRAQMPEEEVLYLGDQEHVPYGSRPPEEVRVFSEEITRFLLAQGAKLIIVACNSASAAALPYLRQTFPDVPFVGMEPAVKLAAEQTRSGIIGVLATPATFQSSQYASMLERFAQNARVLQHTCPGLVEQIEKGELEGVETESILREALMPMLEEGIDMVVLGCSHYPFVMRLIKRIVGQNVQMIDPAPAVARQARRLLEEGSLRHPAREQAPVRYYTTTLAEALESILPLLTGRAERAKQLRWENGKLTE
jgi:glutamate racemase